MFNTGDKVKKITDGKVGVIKNTMNTPSGIRYNVVFDTGAVYLSEDILEPYVEIVTPIECFSNMQFNGIEDYRRILAFQRLNGDLTNMFYSMTNSLTEYLPHQFLPVTKFLQSPEERILIADEVGLGKTVEAMYIWKELEARRNAKRLLVVCPAALREKWKRDMENLFGIHAEIVKADKLLETFHNIEKNRYREQFAYICSMESIRSKKTDDFNTVSNLNRAFEEFAANYSEYAFNLVIIDEAHYLRNRETANFKTGSRLRDIAESLVLLSATPIQTGSENLYSIMNLLAPERFESTWAFDYMLKKDSIFIKLANCLQRPSTTIEDFDEIVRTNCTINAITNSYDNDLIDEIVQKKEEIFSSFEKRMSYASDLREQVFYNNLFNRTRRRFVFDNTAKRKPNAVHFELSDNEMDIYRRVTQLVRDMSKGKSEIMTFALIARQRQMASCLPAAFKDWMEKVKEQFDDVDDEEEIEISEFADENEDDENSTSTKKVYQDLKPFYQKIGEDFTDVHYNELKKYDSKYDKFLESIQQLLKQNPKEKIIVFSFFRGTNAYLEERLREDNINAVAIKGGMGALKDTLLEEFRTDDRINVLISSEVGSEGLDLQFASVEYNYDLPWNPMRLEQRIGRIDRIGQKADVLRIYNLCCENTIEDRILERLYERVKIFETSIGDMEDIVGQPIQELALEILDPTLTDDDRNEKADQRIQVLINQRMMNNKLEDESGVLDEYRDMVLNSIEIAKTNKRCIDVDERLFIVQDFLKNYYPGSTFFQLKDHPNYYSLGLSDDAVLDFREFRRSENLHNKQTAMDSSATGEIIITFKKNEDEKRKIKAEVLDLDHLIFDWIKWTIKKTPVKANGCSAITLKNSELIKPGKYVYYIQKWKKDGVEKSTELKYFMVCVDDNTLVDSDTSERLLNSVVSDGMSLINSSVQLMDFEPYYNAMQVVVNHAWDKFDAFVETYKKKSTLVYNKQVDFVNFTADRKIATVEGIIEKLRFENRKPGVIHMNEKRIEKINHERNLKLKVLEQSQFVEPELSDMAIGVLIAE